MFLLGINVEFRNIRELTQPSVAIGLSTNVYTKVTKAIRTSLFQQVKISVRTTTDTMKVVTAIPR
jgi:hypothetical protein